MVPTAAAEVVWRLELRASGVETCLLTSLQEAGNFECLLDSGSGLLGNIGFGVASKPSSAWRRCWTSLFLIANHGKSSKHSTAGLCLDILPMAVRLWRCAVQVGVSCCLTFLRGVGVLIMFFEVHSYFYDDALLHSSCS